MKDIGWFSVHKQGIAVSIGLHLFFMGVLYCIQQPIPYPGNSNTFHYTIALEAHQLSHPIPSKATTSTKQKEATCLIDKRKNDKPRDKKTAIKLKKQKKQSSHAGSGKSVSKRSPQGDKIDRRGLYPMRKNSTKKSGATLELPGWKWDRIPTPNDTTEECGKIVFEIKVDASGEVISIRTLEKTIPPLVEKIYADELRTLTFSKIATHQSYYSISTGKVSFILVAK